MYAVDRAGLNGFLYVIIIVCCLIYRPGSPMLFPLHLKSLGADANAIGASNAADLIHKDLYKSLRALLQ